jgi:hypothetical protein
VETDLRLYLACMPVQREHLEWRRWSRISVGGRVSRSFDCQLEVVPVDVDLT